MKVMKHEIARAIDKIKSVVQKNEQFPALGGALVSDGYLIGSNTEITVQVKLEAFAGEYFVIPMKAFDLIKNLPDGEAEITANKKHIVTIRMDKIKNSYQSYNPETFSFRKEVEDDAAGIRINGEKLMSALSHVIYAAADNRAAGTMAGIYLEGKDGAMNTVALDGHVIAWDRIKEAVGVTPDVKMIIPKDAAKKLLSIGVLDDVEVVGSRNSVLFRSDEYMIFSRLIDGPYFAYERMFSDAPITTIAARKELIGALTRAKMCTDERKPVEFYLHKDLLNLSINDSVADYEEQIPLQMAMENELRIGFDSKLLLEALKSFDCENISLSFSNGRMPMVIEAEDSDMKAMVLPVVLREEKK